MADSVDQKYNRRTKKWHCGISFGDNCHLQKYTLQITLEFPQNEKLMSYRIVQMTFLKSWRKSYFDREFKW